MLLTTWLTLLLIIVMSRERLSSAKFFSLEAEGFWGNSEELKVAEGWAFLGEVMLKWVRRSVAV
jgi:hypothetical protein